MPALRNKAAPESINVSAPIAYIIFPTILLVDIVALLLVCERLLNLVMDNPTKRMLVSDSGRSIVYATMIPSCDVALVSNKKNR
ncbi:hypothetical protein D3C86_1829710 [compost metagenome]